MFLTYYSISHFNAVQEPHPQPPPRKRGGGYDIPYMIRKSYTSISIYTNRRYRLNLSSIIKVHDLTVIGTIEVLLCQDLLP